MKQLGVRIFAVTFAGLAAACTVQPVYAPTPAHESMPAAALSSIYIEPVKDRVGQQVRNELIFLLNGGAGQPATAVYKLDLTVSQSSTKVLVVLNDLDGEPTASSVKVTGKYRLIRTSDDEEIGSRRASAAASYDLTNQEFANIRAKRDAEDRAAREVAERLRALLVTDMKNAGAL